MTRSDFLAAVGAPEATLAEVERLEGEAQRLWETVRDEFYTAAGKPRAKPPSGAAETTRREVDRIRERAPELRQRAQDQRDAHSQPWSHIQPHWLRKFGLEGVAARVEEAHRRYIEQAEAA